MSIPPAHLDGCSVVILQQRDGLLGGFDAVESGWLSFDGERLEIESNRDSSRREFTDAEQESLIPVSASNHLPQCAGYGRRRPGPP